MPRRLVLGFLVAWSAALFLGELRESWELFDKRTFLGGTAAFWRFGTAQTANVEKCFAEARAIVPKDSVVIFMSPGAEDSQFFAWRWAAYSMPEHDVVQVASPNAVRTARYLIAYDMPVDHPRAVPLKDLTGCRLYRVKPL